MIKRVFKYLTPTLASIVISILFVSCKEKPKETNITIKIGEIINLNDYNLLNINNKEIQNDKLILIDFWATWCGPCIVAFPHLEDIQDKHEESLQIIAVSDEKAETVKRFLEKKEVDLTFMNDPDRSLHKSFDIKSKPTSCLLSENGEFLWAGDSENLDNVLSQYQKTGKITMYEITELNRPYYEVETIENSIKNGFLIQKAENPKRYIVRNQKLDNQPVNIEYVSATIPEIIMDFLNVDHKYIVNNRPELDTILLDIKAQDKTISYGQAKMDILNTIKDRYNFKIQKNTQEAQVYVLEVINEALLNQHLETVEGGGQVQTKEGFLEITRLNLNQLSSVFQKKLDNYVQYQGSSDTKYNLKIKDFKSIEELESSITDIGLSLEKKEDQVEIITIR